MIEQNKIIIRRLFEEAFNQGNLAIVDEVFDAQFIDHSTPDQLPGREGVKNYISGIRASFRTFQVYIEDLIAAEDKVVVRTNWYGISQALATDNEVSGTLIQIFRIHNGKILEEWNEGSGLGD